MSTATVVDIEAHDLARAEGGLSLLADAKRLEILGLLVPGEKNVTEMREAMGASQPAVSHHLALLRVRGWVESRRQGKHNYYSLSKAGRTVVKAAALVATVCG